MKQYFKKTNSYNSNNSNNKKMVVIIPSRYLQSTRPHKSLQVNKANIISILLSSPTNAHILF